MKFYSHGYYTNSSGAASEYRHVVFVEFITTSAQRITAVVEGNAPSALEARVISDFLSRNPNVVDFNRIQIIEVTTNPIIEATVLE